MKFEDLIGTGRIGEIISALKTTYNVDNTRQLSEDIKLNALLTSLQVSGLELDEIIANNSPVFRTIKGHAFEIAFEYLIKAAGFEVTSIGGDGNVDLIVNKVKLQLKTPYSAGTAGSIVQYKTHKTHGAKSEKESMDYYHHADEFADYLVGLISYEPLRIIFISKDELPRHSKSKHHILSPFKIDWETHSVDSRLFKAETLYRETYDLLFAKYGNNISQKIFKNTIEKKGDTETTLKENEPILITDFLQKMYDDSKSGKRKTVDGMKFKPGSIKPYISTKNHFVAFSKRRKYYLTDIDQTLINDFTEYLNGFLALNASAKYLTVLKSLISFATQKKLISINVSLENKVIVRKAKADDIYLTEKEIQEIMDIKEFPTKKIEEVRDLFVIGCNTGLRFQDY
jgi:intergrase/recombinase